jgi:hypothetical protein
MQFRKSKEQLLAKTPEEKCASLNCYNRRARKSNGCFYHYCWKCLSRKYRAAQPAAYVLNMIRVSARRRHITFSLTAEQFKEFCASTGFLEHRGREPHSWTIDRINPNEGYHIWNIRVLSHAENSAQGCNNQKSERHPIKKEQPTDLAADDISETDPF